MTAPPWFPVGVVVVMSLVFPTRLDPSAFCGVSAEAASVLPTRWGPNVLVAVTYPQLNPRCTGTLKNTNIEQPSCGNVGNVLQHLLKMHVAPGNRYVLPFWVFLGLKAPAVAGRVTKMAITRFRGSKTRGTFDRRMRNFLLCVFVRRNIC